MLGTQKMGERVDPPSPPLRRLLLHLKKSSILKRLRKIKASPEYPMN